MFILNKQVLFSPSCNLLVENKMQTGTAQTTCKAFNDKDMQQIKTLHLKPDFKYRLTGFSKRLITCSPLFSCNFTKECEIVFIVRNPKVHILFKLAK